MGGAARAGRIVGRPGADLDAEGHHRRVMSLSDHETSAIGQREVLDFAFEILEILGGGQQRAEQ